MFSAKRLCIRKTSPIELDPDSEATFEGADAPGGDATKSSTGGDATRVSSGNQAGTSSAGGVATMSSTGGDATRVSTGNEAGSSSSGEPAPLLSSAKEEVMISLCPAEDHEEETQLKISVLQQLRAVLSTASIQIEFNLNRVCKTDLEKLLFDAKRLQNYLEYSCPEKTPPCSFDDIVVKWLQMKPVVEAFT
jgi:hypothetical protein